MVEGGLKTRASMPPINASNRPMNSPKTAKNTLRIAKTIINTPQSTCDWGREYAIIPDSMVSRPMTMPIMPIVVKREEAYVIPADKLAKFEISDEKTIYTDPPRIMNNPPIIPRTIAPTGLLPAIIKVNVKCYI